MEFIDFKLVSALISIILFGIGFPFMLSRWKVSSIQLNSINLEFYEKLKELCGTNAKNNLPTLLVAIQDYAKCELKPFEIEWFIHIPGAFRLLKKFGSCKKFIEVDKELNLLRLKDKYSTKKNRMIERGKVFFIYCLLGTLGGLGLFSSSLMYSLFGVLTTIFAIIGSIFCIILALFFLREMTKVDDAVRLVNDNIYSFN
ncbi:hypothetical protein CJF42_16230 [Pseudoalteromonas sp. NBT06-2]|uniref:hypothetical protein n=1 Tax=Pseudoalteromonas sp. NBT06-2 TaxID=2025950 RepID=UPI000BA6C8A1|nr:hypothetical protein [Pseudoalteromonas sp. NBT06-2]PAJ73338.1 hypothetical protein CJF42_16230 [Pseudoalteromonas sp. NBT06-2]